MDANELADWLDNIANLKDWGEQTKYYKNRLKNAATMLLQLESALIAEQEHNLMQQAEIEALKQLLDDFGITVKLKAQEKYV